MRILAISNCLSSAFFWSKFLSPDVPRLALRPLCMACIFRAAFFSSKSSLNFLILSTSILFLVTCPLKRVCMTNAEASNSSLPWSFVISTSYLKAFNSFIMARVFSPWLEWFFLFSFLFLVIFFLVLALLLIFLVLVLIFFLAPSFVFFFFTFFSWCRFSCHSSFRINLFRLVSIFFACSFFAWSAASRAFCLYFTLELCSISSDDSWRL